MTLNNRMKLLTLGLLIPIGGCASANDTTTMTTGHTDKLSPTGPPKPFDSEKTAIKIARDYAEKAHPNINFSQEPAKVVSQGQAGWRVELGGFPRIDPATGRTFGHCGYYTKTVLIAPDGSISFPISGMLLCW